MPGGIIYSRRRCFPYPVYEADHVRYADSQVLQSSMHVFQRRHRTVGLHTAVQLLTLLTA